MFPAITVVSTAPLTAIVLAGNVASFFPKITEGQLRLIRVLVWVIPAAIAFATHELGTIAAISGIPGYFIYYAINYIIHIGACAKIPKESPEYKGWHSSLVLSWTGLIICCALTVFNLIYLGQ